MSPLVVYHATRRACRESIWQRGLLPNRPWTDRPYGVYVFNDELCHRVAGTFQGGAPCQWGAMDHQDVWQVSYIGPFTNDRLVRNGVILLEPVPPTELHLLRVTNEW